MRIEVAVMAEAPIVVAGLRRLLELHDRRGEVILRELGLWEPFIPEDIDIVLYDIFGPDRRFVVIPPALDVRETRERRGRARLILFGWQLDPTVLDNMLEAHEADGYISKGLPGPELVHGLVRAARESDVVVTVPTPDYTDARTSAIYPGIEAGLTERESSVMAMIAQGLSNEQIAGRMHISQNTLKFYIRGAYKKLGLARRGEAVAWGRSHGFDAVDVPRTYVVLHPLPPSETQ